MLRDLRLRPLVLLRGPLPPGVTGPLPEGGRRPIQRKSHSFLLGAGDRILREQGDHGRLDSVGLPLGAEHYPEHRQVMEQEVPARRLDGLVALHIRWLRHMAVPQTGMVGAPIPEVPYVFEPIGEVSHVEGAEILGQRVEFVRSGKRSWRENTCRVQIESA